VIGLETFGFHVDGRCVPVGELASDLRAETYGIESVLVADELDGFELAARAAERCLRDDPRGGRGIGAVVLAALRVPTALVASDAARLQHRLGLTDAVAFSVGDLGCASTSVAVSLATALLGPQRWERVLVVHGTAAPAWPRHRKPVTVLGDAGVAVIVGRAPVFEILAERAETDGRFWDLFSVDYGKPRADWAEKCRDEREFVVGLTVETRRRVARLTADVLDEAGLSPGQLDCLVTQNTSTGALTFHADVTGVGTHECCAANLRRYGHLGPVDVLLNLSGALATLPGGAHVLVVNSSPVAAWSVSVGRVRR
jgi:3-oxoacyl-[acyl-carrier-protein] synthase-3